MNNKTLTTLIVLSLITVPFTAGAHQRELYNIGGTDYLMVVGSLGEPLIVDDKTGLDLRVVFADPVDPTNASASGVKPAVGLEKSLKLEIIAGDKKKVQDISTVYGTLGSYKTVFFPTVQTTLTYRIFGTINEKPIDLSFTCNPAGHVAAPEDKTEVSAGDGVVRKFKAGQFGCPQAKSEFGFPEAAMTSYEIHKDGETHLSAFKTDVDKEIAESSSVALALSLVGALLGGIALFRTRKSKV